MPPERGLQDWRDLPRHPEDCLDTSIDNFSDYDNDTTATEQRGTRQSFEPGHCAIVQDRR
jgi:hypothetical protein